MSLVGENIMIKKYGILLLSGMLSFCPSITQAQVTNPYITIEDVAIKTFCRIKKANS
jgi:hypothetical protein